MASGKLFNRNVLISGEGSLYVDSRKVIDGDSFITGTVVPTNADVETISAAKTLDAADSGKVFKVDTTAVITLPSTAVGITYYLVNDGASDGDVQISVSPAAADQIIGIDLTPADNKDLINTLATSKKGDFVKIFGDGVSGWYVQAVAGTWAREA